MWVKKTSPKRELSVPEKHQLAIAWKTLKMPDEIVGVMGPPSKAEAREIIYKLTGKYPNEKKGGIRTKNSLQNEGAHLFKLGDKVTLRPDILKRHSRSVPPQAGYTTEEFKWRDILDKLEGEVGVIERVFPNSKHVNVQFENNLIGIDHTELLPAEQNTEVTKEPAMTKDSIAKSLIAVANELDMNTAKRHKAEAITNLIRERMTEDLGPIPCALCKEPIVPYQVSYLSDEFGEWYCSENHFLGQHPEREDYIIKTHDRVEDDYVEDRRARKLSDRQPNELPRNSQLKENSKIAKILNAVADELENAQGPDDFVSPSSDPDVAQVKSDYEVDKHGIIHTPGKFEGEMYYVSHFYDEMMGGAYDDEVVDTDDTVYTLFNIAPEDVQKFPELKGTKNLVLWESDSGFVNSKENVDWDKMLEDIQYDMENVGEIDPDLGY